MKTLYTILFFSSLFLYDNANSKGIKKPRFISANAALNDTISTGAAESILPESSVSENDPLFGVASFYNNSFIGSPTATGETFVHQKLTAASNFFKLNSWVRVTNLRNGKSVIVRINDRMHPRMAKKGRVVDLTLTGAKKIGLTVLAGLAKVKVELVDKRTIE